MKIFTSTALVALLTFSLVNCQQMNHNRDLFNSFTPIYGFDTSASDETGILLETSTVNAKFDCFLKCNLNSACKMSSFKSNQCKLFSQVKYSVPLSPTSDTCLFEKFVPDYSAINAYLTNWWPFNNNVKDVIGGADLYSPTGSVSFTTDRLNQASSALYLNNAYYKLPDGAYFAGDYTLALWIKVHSLLTTTDRILGLGGTAYLVFSLKGAAGPWIGMSIHGNFDSLTQLQMNKWQHLAFTLLNGAVCTIYVDGQMAPQANRVYYGAPPNVVYVNNQFGGWGGGNSPNAEFDDVKIYNRSLTQDEIKKVLNSYY